MEGNDTQRYLVFELDGNAYAVEVERVEVVLEMVPITRVPRAQPHLRGVINYRGAVIPVADLRVRFGEEKTDLEVKASIIVLQVSYGTESVTLGVLADSVREVIDLDRSRISKAPNMGNARLEGLVRGVYEQSGEFIIVLDIDRAFALEGVEA